MSLERKWFALSKIRFSFFFQFLHIFRLIIWKVRKGRKTNSYSLLPFEISLHNVIHFHQQLLNFAFFGELYISCERECPVLPKHELRLIVHAGFYQFLANCQKRKTIFINFSCSVTCHLRVRRFVQTIYFDLWSFSILATNLNQKWKLLVKIICAFWTLHFNALEINENQN